MTKSARCCTSREGIFHGAWPGRRQGSPRSTDSLRKSANLSLVDALWSILQGLSALIRPQIISILTRRASEMLQPVRSMPLQFRAMSENVHHRNRASSSRVCCSCSCLLWGRVRDGCRCFSEKRTDAIFCVRGLRSCSAEVHHLRDGDEKEGGVTEKTQEGEKNTVLALRRRAKRGGRAR